MRDPTILGSYSVPLWAFYREALREFSPLHDVARSLKDHMSRQSLVKGSQVFPISPNKG